MRIAFLKDFSRDDLSSVAVALIAFVIPFSFILIPYFIGLLVIAMFIQTDLIIKIKKAFTSKFLILPYTYYVVHIIGLIYTSNMDAGLFNLEVKASLLILPLALFTSQTAISKRIKFIISSFIAGNLITAVYCLVNAFLISFQGGYFSPLNTEQPELWSYSKVLFSGYSYFNYSNLSALIHVNYYAMYVLLAMYLIYHHLMVKNDLLEPKLKWFYIVLIIFFTLFFILLQSRSALLTLIVILIVEFLYHFSKPGRIKTKIAIFITSLVIFTTIIGTSDRIKRIYEGTSVPSYTEIRKSEIRLALWEIAIPIIKENPLLGVGTGDVDDEYVRDYNPEYLEHSNGRYLNVHNEYLQTAMRLGIPVMLLLVVIILYPLIFREAIRERRYVLAFTIIILISCLFEAILSRLNGVVFFTLFYCLFGILLTRKSFK